MDQRSKIAVALGVMFAGVAVALAFRHESPRPGVVPPGALDRLVLQSRLDDPPRAGGPALRPPAPLDSPSGGLVAPAPFPPPAVDPPRMAPAFSANPAGPPGAVEKPLRHKIVDGDTLASLAQRYLGSADRAMEIYQRNRELLPSPELLPIGVEIGIPKAE